MSYDTRHFERYQRAHYLTRRRSPHRGKWRAVLLFSLIALVCAGAFAAWNGRLEALAQQVLGPLAVGSSPAGASTTQASSGITEADSSLLTVPTAISDVADTRHLELINSGHPLSREADEVLLLSAAGQIPMLFGGVMLRQEALTAVMEFSAAAQAAGKAELFVSSGYRDYALQKQLYEEAPDTSFVQPPNKSEHQTGLAVDVFPMGEDETTMASSGAGHWMAANSWRFGLILRYPEGKQKTTGIAYEPWHFRYVGVPHAWFCAQNGLCFEEYIQHLKDTGGYSATLDGRKYTVLYQVPEDGLIYLPEGTNYSVSSDNTDGFVVTVWE